MERLRRRLAAEGRWRKATLEELEKDRCASAADEAMAKIACLRRLTWRSTQMQSCN
uniref:GTD-binding domain-containing protein n=1 Tax=Oryza rufipogon TaxID=4529 RepID=A0A0E0MVB6_ORYRU